MSSTTVSSLGAGGGATLGNGQVVSITKKMFWFWHLMSPRVTWWNTELEVQNFSWLTVCPLSSWASLAYKARISWGSRTTSWKRMEKIKETHTISFWSQLQSRRQPSSILNLGVFSRQPLIKCGCRHFPPDALRALPGQSELFCDVNFLVILWKW